MPPPGPSLRRLPGSRRRSPATIGVLAIDAQDSTLKAIEDGWISATLNQCWFNASPQAAKRIIEAKNGPASAEFIPIAVDPVTKDQLPYDGLPAGAHRLLRPIGCRSHRSQH